ncbi:DUF2807 domain-containing protein [Sphingomonas sanguinis]|uniref:GIN domain-containing protein n=1 Tax=Sphingomonas sanguinis TaxID=33051 RepID=UPI001C564DB4|nr:DUF2807 domain-containing protein [Sphingomonas sanguinis]QXT35753.1 DUF2807 domain-containing protein [Sphingomonas sanguinis]
MKTILPLSLILSALPVAAAPAQAQTARSFALSGFDRISLEGCDNAVVTVGNAFSVRAVGQPVSLEVIRAEVRQQKLIITRPNRMCDSRAKRPGATIEITVPRLRGVESEGTGSIRLHPFEAAEFEAEMSGTGNLTMEGLRGRKVGIAMSGTGNAQMQDIRVTTLALDVNGTGSIRGAGAVDALSIDSSGTGNVDTTAMTTRILSVDASGTGGVRAQANGPAAIDASGMTRVVVGGRPQCTVDKSGFARVTCG